MSLPALSLLETRVLGVLVEKQHTVPDTYPLTLNALTSGCNQKTSRDPVLEATEAEVQAVVDRLKGLSLVVESSGGRVMRYAHNVGRVLGVPAQAVALLTVIMLRGPQTVGELRIHSERLHRFADISSVEAFLEELAHREAGPLVVELARQPGARETRWAHLLSGAPAPSHGGARGGERRRRRCPAGDARRTRRAQDERRAARRGARGSAGDRRADHAGTGPAAGLTRRRAFVAARGVAPHPRPAGQWPALPTARGVEQQIREQVMDFSSMYESAKPIVLAMAMKVVVAIVLYIVGRWLIGIVGSLINKALERQKIEPTVIRYMGNTINVVLNVLLVIGILGYFGVETTSFAALIAALGIAIGAAWGGLLSNFAAGVFVLVLRPFKVGDYVLAGEVEGTVRAIGLFTTAIDTPDNVNTMVGNAKVMNGTIKNFSHNPFRRVDLTAQLDHSVDPQDAIRRLQEVLPTIANVVKDPVPSVEILTFNERGPVLAVRPFVHTDHYWQVYFDTNKAIRATFGAAGYPAAEAHLFVRQKAV